MPQLLTLRGRHALSPFRLTKLLSALSATRPQHAVAGIDATYWHFVETGRDLDASERATLERILIYGPHDAAAAETGDFLLVVPRPGTISPWSSKATDIARNCGLAAVTRIERGVGFHVAMRDGATLPAADRAALLPLLHDRMTEAVLDDLAAARALFAHYPPRPLTTIPLLAQGRDAIVAANVALGLALAADEIDYLAEQLPPLGPRSDRCRADDVRAGELRALPAQDLQRRLGDRRRRAGTEPVRDDPAHARDDAAGHAGRLFRQRGGDRRHDGGALPSGRRRPLRRAPRDDAHPAEGRDPQPSDGDRAVPGGRHRLRRRDPRRGCHRDAARSRRRGSPASRCRTCASRRCRSPGKRPTASPTASPRRCDIMLEGPIGGASFNNEFGRPNLLGYFRSFEQTRGRRGPRLPQADHDRRRRGQHLGRARAQGSRSPTARC